MGHEEISCAYCNGTDNSGTNKTRSNEGGDVPEVDSKDIVLRFMDAHPIPLRPKEVYGGLITEGDISFSYRTVQNKISELTDEGLIKRVEIDDDDGVVRDIPEDEGGRRAYYLITEEGSAQVD